MLISASRRTDIPSYYSDWFFNRIREGFVLVRNPMNTHQISKISLSPDVVDGIVFWSKNPAPMLNRLNELKSYSYYFQFTVTPYATDIEPGIPSKNDSIIPIFKQLSDTIGSDRVVWRYDPILINKKYNLNYHLKYFEELAKRLSKYTKKCTISFIDFYRNTTRNIRDLDIIELSMEEKLLIAANFSNIACSYNLQMDTCAEDIDLDQFGITHARCIDDRLFELITGSKLIIEKDKTQRLECGCVSSIDIGMYNTCLNGCRYCYANYSKSTVKKNFSSHDQYSPLLSGIVNDEDKISERKMFSCKDCQREFKF